MTEDDVAQTHPADSFHEVGRVCPLQVLEKEKKKS